MKKTPTNSFQWAFLYPKYWGIWLGYAALWLISRLPYNSKFALGRSLGRLLYRLAPSRRRLARRNLQLAFAEKSADEIDTILKQHFESLGTSLIETSINLWHPQRKRPKGTFDTQHIQINGLEHLQSSSDQGVLLVVPHFTTVETTGMMLASVMSFHPVYRKHDNPLVEYIITKSRSYHQNTCVDPIPNTQTRTMIKALRNGETLWIAPDQRYRGRNRLEVPFFDHPAPSNPGICKLAEMGKARVLPVFTRRIGNDYQLNILPGLADFPSGNDYEDILRLHRLYEAEIRENPAQYLWTHNRWDLPKEP